MTLKNQVINLRNLDYNALTNIRNAKTVIARKCERMYQVEALLNRYCKFAILDSQYLGINISNYSDWDEFEKIDLSKHKVDWNDFCDIIKSLNEKEIFAENEYWEKNKYYYNVKLTALGLDEMVLPGTPMVYKRYIR